MKIFKIFALVAMMFGMVACEDNNEGDSIIDNDYTMSYKGTVTVVVDGELFDSPNKEIEVYPASDGKSLNILFKKMKFVPTMPVSLDVTIPNVSFVQLNGTTRLVADDIVPTCVFGKQEKYIVTNLQGTLTESTLELTLNFGEYPTSFKGTK